MFGNSLALENNHPSLEVACIELHYHVYEQHNDRENTEPQGRMSSQLCLPCAFIGKDYTELKVVVHNSHEYC